jgi:hypothetical protein
MRKPITNGAAGGLIKRGLKNASTLELILERRQPLGIHP